MNQFDTPPGQKRTGVIVVGLVVVGLVLVGTGGYLVYSKKKNNNGSGAPSGLAEKEAAEWCKIRREWAQKVQPLVGDILLKSVKAADKEERDKLVLKRNTLCQQYARKVADLKVTNPALQEAEVAMVKEGKTRANVSVEIDNLVAKIDAPDTAALRKNRDQIERYIKGRIQQGKATAENEVKAGLAKLGQSACNGIFHGTVTDEGTTGNPYVSWDELELKRTQALKQYDDKIKEMEPVEQFTNRVYHDLVARYRGTLKKCYAKAKAANNAMSDKMGLRIRLKPNGKVKTLAIEWMINREEKILDCLLETASKWKLPRPDPETKMVVVSLDFTRL
jgi:hypothetical protein